MEERGQFTFYRSFYDALMRIKKKNERVDAYDAVCLYALTGKEPDLDKLPDAVAVAFLLIKPNLDVSRRKAENGKRGGNSQRGETASSEEANPKQSGSKPEANDKQTTSKPEARADGKQGEAASEKEKEKEKENEIEKELENECSLKESEKEKPVPGGAAAPTRTAAKEPKHKHGKYGWVLLTDEEYTHLVAELGEAEAERCIAYVDERAQLTGNKNRWKDWNLVVRSCSREGWGKRYGGKNAAPSAEERREAYAKNFGSAYAEMKAALESGKI